MADTYVIDASGRASISKDPDAVLDYSFDWSAWLDAIPDTIATAQCIGTGITVNQSSIVGKKVVAWVAGGTRGTTGILTCRITTNGGRTDDRSIYLKIRER